MNNESPGNDGLTKEFYKSFWKKLKNPNYSITFAPHNNEQNQG